MKIYEPPPASADIAQQSHKARKVMAGKIKGKTAAVHVRMESVDSDDSCMNDAGNGSDNDACETAREADKMGEDDYPISRALTDGLRMPRPETLPIIGESLHDEDFEPRQLLPMRVEQFSIGMEVVWIPQCFTLFLECHGEQLSQDANIDALLSTKVCMRTFPDSTDECQLIRPFPVSCPCVLQCAI